MDDEDRPPLAPMPKECQHQWQDFPWYVEGTYHIEEGYFECQIIEPYVCVLCKKRENKVLMEYHHQATEKEADKFIDGLRKRFKGKILHQIEVEDMINDFLMVDRDYLHGYHLVHGTKDPSVSVEQSTDQPKLRL